MTSTASSPIFLTISSSPTSNRRLVYEPSFGCALRSRMTAKTRVRVSANQCLQIAVKTGHIPGVAGRAGWVNHRQQRISVTVHEQPEHRLRVAADRALVPDFAPTA